MTIRATKATDFPSLIPVRQTAFSSVLPHQSAVSSVWVDGQNSTAVVLHDTP